MNDAQLRVKALATLKQELGMADTLSFLALINQNSTDYVEIYRQIYEEQQYEHLVELLDSLIDQVGEDEAHPLASIMDMIGVLIENYEAEHIPALDEVA